MRKTGPPRTGVDVGDGQPGRAHVVGVAAEPVERDVADGHEPLLVALADDPDEAAVEREVLRVEAERLADPQAGRVEQLEQRRSRMPRPASARVVSPPADASSSRSTSVDRQRLGQEARSRAAGRCGPRRPRRSGPRRRRTGRSRGARPCAAAGSCRPAAAAALARRAAPERRRGSATAASGRLAHAPSRAARSRAKSARSDAVGARSSPATGRARRGGGPGSPRSLARGTASARSAVVSRRHRDLGPPRLGPVEQLARAGDGRRPAVGAGEHLGQLDDPAVAVEPVGPR